MADEQPWHIVSADYLNTLGNFFIKWSGDFSNAHVGSLEMKVTPGQAQPAYAFKTVFWRTGPARTISNDGGPDSW